MFCGSCLPLIGIGESSSAGHCHASGHAGKASDSRQGDPIFDSHLWRTSFCSLFYLLDDRFSVDVPAAVHYGQLFPSQGNQACTARANTFSRVSASRRLSGDVGAGQVTADVIYIDSLIKLSETQRRAVGSIMYRGFSLACTARQVSSIQEMGAAQDDLCVGGSAIPEATSAGW